MEHSDAFYFEDICGEDGPGAAKVNSGIIDRKHEPVFVTTDDEGIETVYRFLEGHGFTEGQRAQQGGTLSEPVTYDIRESRILVSGGGGVAGSFGKLQTLAQSLGARVSSSRRLVDGGIAPRRIQVGQSGKRVSCDLYIAIGIYGAFQHVIGINKVKHLIVVNTDALAPICSLADIVVQGDAIEFIEKLTDRINSAASGGCTENIAAESGADSAGEEAGSL